MWRQPLSVTAVYRTQWHGSGTWVFCPVGLAGSVTAVVPLRGLWRPTPAPNLESN